MKRLSPAQLAQYERHGFLLIEDFKSTQECAALRARAAEKAAGNGLLRCFLRLSFFNQRD
jgi:hypothetical protein